MLSLDVELSLDDYRGQRICFVNKMNDPDAVGFQAPIKLGLRLLERIELFLVVSFYGHP